MDVYLHILLVGCGISLIATMCVAPLGRAYMTGGSVGQVGTYNQSTCPSMGGLEVHRGGSMNVWEVLHTICFGLILTFAGFQNVTVLVSRGFGNGQWLRSLVGTVVGGVSQS